MRRPLISVVMPVHDGGAWLDAALASIRPLPAAAIEVVIRDSTPAGPCGAIVERHAHRFSIDYAYCPDVPSWTRKTNMAVEAATARHVAMLHQDDLWLADRVAVAAEMIARHPEAAMHLTPARIVDGEGRDLGPWRAPFSPGVVSATEARDALLVQNSIAIPAPVFLRETYLAVGGLDESLWYTPDWDLWLKLAHRGPVIYDPRPSTAFRIHSGSQTMTGSRDVADFREQMERVLARHNPTSLPVGDPRIGRVAKASIEINCALAQAAAGKGRAFGNLARTLLGLGPTGVWRYLKYSRIVERVVPRLRLRLAGAL